MEHVGRCAIIALKNTSGLNLKDTAHIRSILRPIIQQNLPRGMHNLKFPAKQILATPVSTVAVEQEFSAGGNILVARRSVLSPESIQVQVCVDDWTKAEYRQQEMEPEVIYDFFDDDHTTGTGTEDSY
ncbi:hypothetical protein Ddye_023925 [Dipteronia dyeriana]|uniref:HAT C-terminal dimerisation domain-containing protein n=1 Tax=Dipteronia dyeriana TaxID=168575 RepID=A0AAD9TUC4_9ROSI|nr:hypothetical protein Ddye_023925 [Dipteronia dyeriana]